MSGAENLFEGVSTAESERERERVAAGELPPRYGEPWARPFFEAARPALRDGARILDVGSGRSPTLPPQHRPPGAEYVGQDVSRDELIAAPVGSYDEVSVGSIEVPDPALRDRFDLILSWQVLEHVESLPAALEVMQSYLVPGGRMVAQLSGSQAVYALLARAIPYRVSTKLMERLLGAEPEEKFPTHYHSCTYRSLDRLLSSWSEHGVIPRYKAGAYFRFSRPLERVYLAYENWTERSQKRNLATHYVIWGVR